MKVQRKGSQRRWKKGCKRKWEWRHWRLVGDGSTKENPKNEDIKKDKEDKSDDVSETEDDEEKEHYKFWTVGCQNLLLRTILFTVFKWNWS